MALVAQPALLVAAAMQGVAPAAPAAMGFEGVRPPGHPAEYDPNNKFKVQRQALL